ncbi:hypothetical protein [Pseudomonas putida]|uniref:hypothetical protein n=1 Tax=Pseudomonas putida TaxID=303 RepID=UPI00235C82A6|nr:hypothetical protein [Pseudomonas putida]GLO46355.1 hypothetical protein PPUN109347_29180 [Pseudomonas putida]HDS0980566.1 hypothetical protein [Pseudomonas putida]
MSIKVKFKKLAFDLDPKKTATLCNVTVKDEVLIYDTKHDIEENGVLSGINKSLAPEINWAAESPAKLTHSLPDKNNTGTYYTMYVYLPDGNSFEPSDDQAEVLLRTPVGEQLAYKGYQYKVAKRFVAAYVDNGVEGDSAWYIHLE